MLQLCYNQYQQAFTKIKLLQQGGGSSRFLIFLASAAEKTCKSEILALATFLVTNWSKYDLRPMVSSVTRFVTSSVTSIFLLHFCYNLLHLCYTLVTPLFI